MSSTQSHNRLYYSDNVSVLEALLEEPSVMGQVRLVYIDPPFGTGQILTTSHGRNATVSRANNGHIAYSDQLIGQLYLNFLRPRLELLRELLADDGSIYVHSNVQMEHHIRLLMDEVFGAQNCRGVITRIKCHAKNFERRGYGNVKDAVLFYSKSKRFVWNQARVSFTEDDIRRLFPKRDATGRRYTTTPLHGPGETKNGPTGREWKGLRPPKGRHWRSTPDILDNLDRSGLIEWSSTGNPRKKSYADEAEKIGKLLQDIWKFKDPKYPQYPTEKNLNMLKVIVGASSNLGDLVLDAFCGSGTTLVAAQQLGRRWIGIDDSEVAIGVAKERLADLEGREASAAPTFSLIT